MNVNDVLMANAERQSKSRDLAWYYSLETDQLRVPRNTHPDFEENTLKKYSHLQESQNTELKYFYPTPSEHCEIRHYQIDCLETALKQNCMISLPTGLGKTFIAAVLMYNYQKFYPDASRSRFIFLAPTKALVDQQVMACAKIMEKPEDFIRCVHSSKNKQTSVAMQKEKESSASLGRLKSYMNDKRCFLFMTPQTLENDLKNDVNGDFSKMIRLIVVDEAHRATGGYAYVNCIRNIHKFNRCYRICALSATPGNNEEKCQEILDNLLIEKVRFYHEGHPDIAAYVFKKDVRTFKLNLPSENLVISNGLSSFVNSWRIGIFKSFYGLSLEDSSLETIRQRVTSASVEGRNFLKFVLPGWLFFYLKMFYDYIRKYGIVAGYNCVCQFMDESMLTSHKNRKKDKNTDENNNGSVHSRLAERLNVTGWENTNAALENERNNMTNDQNDHNSKKSKTPAKKPAKKPSKGQSMKIQMARKCQKDDNFKSWFKQLKILRDEIINEENMKRVTGSVNKKYSHPKFRTIAQQIQALLCRKDRKDAQVIIFVPLRQLANELYSFLKEMGKIGDVDVKPGLILGKGTGGGKKIKIPDDSEPGFEANTYENDSYSGINLTTKQQQQELDDFRVGKLNIACATCVAEEGLDIGKIDMVIMFDIFKNITRFTQRLGRCGRKRDGKCILLSTNNTDEVSRVSQQKADFDAKFQEGYESEYYNWLKHGKVCIVSKRFCVKLHSSEPDLKREFIDYTEDKEVDLRDFYDLNKKTDKITSSGLGKQSKRKSVETSKNLSRKSIAEKSKIQYENALEIVNSLKKRQRTNISGNKTFTLWLNKTEPKRFYLLIRTWTNSMPFLLFMRNTVMLTRKIFGKFHHHIISPIRRSLFIIAFSVKHHLPRAQRFQIRVLTSHLKYRVTV